MCRRIKSTENHHMGGINIKQIPSVSSVALKQRTPRSKRQMQGITEHNYLIVYMGHIARPFALRCTRNWRDHLLLLRREARPARGTLPLALLSRSNEPDFLRRHGTRNVMALTGRRSRVGGSARSSTAPTSRDSNPGSAEHTADLFNGLAFTLGPGVSLHKTNAGGAVSGVATLGFSKQSLAV